MKIGIDARMYGAGKNRGIGRYINRLLDNLQLVDKENQYIIFLLKENYDDFKVISNNFTKVVADISWYSIKEQLVWPFLINRYNLDLMHFPHFNVPFLYKGDFVITIHDLIMTHYQTDRSTTKNKMIYKLKIKIARRLASSAAKKAKLIYVPSNFSKQEVVEKLKIDQRKIKVTYEAVDEMIDKTEINLKDKFKITKPYFFYVGAAYPHKNLELAVKAWQKFNQEDEYQLVMAGRIDYFYKRLSKESIGDDKSILLLGKISDTDLVNLYKQAKAFIFPSLVEGFGLPPLEAMSQGCPVISSNAACMVEILNGAALMFEKNSEKDLLDALNKIITEQDLCTRLIAAGHKQVASFSWKRMASDTASGYNFCKS